MRAEKGFKGPQTCSEKHQRPQKQRPKDSLPVCVQNKNKVQLPCSQFFSARCCQNVLSSGRRFLCHQLLINGQPTGRIAAVKKRKKASNRSFPHTFSVPTPVMRLLLSYVASVLKHVAQRRCTSSDPFRSLLILFVDSRLFPFILPHPP